MLLFLQIVGGIVVGIIALIVLVYAYFRMRYGKWADYLETDSEPLQIHLNEDYSPAWRDEGDAAQFIEDLKSCGFEMGKAYTVVELEGVNVQSLFQPPFVATVWTHPMAATWIDVSFKARDSALEIDVSNAGLGETINSRPEARKIYRDGARAAELLAVAREEVGEETGELINDSNFREQVEESYRKDMAWRCNQGGMSYDEFVATAQAGDEKYDDSQIREAFIETKVRELHRWHEAAMQRIQELDRSFFESIYENGREVFMLPTNGNVEAYIRYIGEQGVIDEEQTDSMVETFSGQSDLQMVANRIFSGISSDLRPRKLRDIDFPIAGELYEYSW